MPSLRGSQPGSRNRSITHDSTVTSIYCYIHGKSNSRTKTGKTNFGGFRITGNPLNNAPDDLGLVAESHIQIPFNRIREHFTVFISRTLHCVYFGKISNQLRVQLQGVLTHVTTCWGTLCSSSSMHTITIGNRKGLKDPTLSAWSVHILGGYSKAV